MRALALLLVLTASPAWAHGGGHEPERWLRDGLAAAALALAALLYLHGLYRLRGRVGRRRRGPRAGAIACFSLGWLAAALALLSPLGQADGTVFAAHMIEHEILMLVSAPLLVAARPGGVLLWGWPTPVRQRIGAAAATPPLRRAWRALTDPVTAWLLHGAIVWIWHAPGLFEAAVADQGVHTLQHVSFFGSAVLFWWAMLEGSRRHARQGVAVVHLFTTSLHTGLLGALMTFAPAPWYASYGPGGWGLTPLEDQQLAGLIMWIPAGFVYVGTGLFLIRRWFQALEARAMRGVG
jgi:putative membrane protein